MKDSQAWNAFACACACACACVCVCIWLSEPKHVAVN